MNRTFLGCTLGLILGVMLKAASANNGYLLVINTMDLTFTEVATSITTAFVKSGMCEE